MEILNCLKVQFRCWQREANALLFPESILRQKGLGALRRRFLGFVTLLYVHTYITITRSHYFPFNRSQKKNIFQQNMMQALQNF